MKYNVTLGDKVYEVEVERGEAVLLGVTDAAAPAPVAAAAAPVSPAPAAPAPAQAPAAAGEPVKSPLPGVIFSVKVNPGDSVKAGDILLVIEAMKMENEILAPRDGKVAQVIAAKGSTVNTGDTLLILA